MWKLKWGWFDINRYNMNVSVDYIIFLQSPKSIMNSLVLKLNLGTDEFV